MPIFRLMPRRLEDPAWQASTYTGVVLVRAADSPLACLLAMGRFSRAVAVQYRPLTLWHPWLQERLVTCTRVEEAGYDEDGPEAVLWPADAGRMLMTPEEQATDRKGSPMPLLRLTPVIALGRTGGDAPAALGPGWGRERDGDLAVVWPYAL